jgi:hypothetical protein
MRRANNARRHARERTRQGPLPRSNHARALADDVAEGAPERAEALPSGMKGDLGDRKLGITEQRCRSLDAPTQEVPMRRDAERSFERSREVGFGHPANAREPPYRPLLV